MYVGWIHWIAQYAGFMCLLLFFHPCSAFCMLLLILPPLISPVLLFLADIEILYAGLSGVLHGMFTAIAIVHLLYRKERMFASLVLFLI